MRKLGFRLLVLVLAFLMVSPLLADNHGDSILDKVKKRGRLICGVNKELPGFGYLGQDGEWKGFDVDFGRAIAAAVLGDSSKVEFRSLKAADRFPALQTGEIDVLIRNTTWTLTRDTANGADFCPPNFYDGQGFMLRKGLEITSLKDLDGATIGVTAGSTTELNLADKMRTLGIKVESIVFEETETLYQSYDQGRCDAVTSDKSQLIARKQSLKNPDEHIILDVTISKEPLAPVTVHGDNKWNDVVSWVVYATFFAEEHGITKAKVKNLKSDNPEIQRFLGETGNIGEQLGLPADWARNAIGAVGHYGEIFERNLTPLGLPRGVNKPWTEGGLLYAMPFR
ncbi:MAG: amino acid ABC transporter substrate-binding protein [Candidatus Poribacteria bacterium]|nr:amino acid ABC transporter substrate-binding protein [Candidatus Poribacteria bacterium]